MITGFEKVLLALMIFVLMVGMGSTLSFSDFGKYLKRPRGIIVGFLCQFGLMPFIAFGLAYLFKLPTEIAIGLILVGCTPGGTTSNMFTYFSKGDVALSISMTVASTVTAFVMMPFLLSLYTAPFVSADFVIPYKNIIATLVIVIVPVLIGIAVRSKSEKTAKIVEKVGSYAGIAVILVTIVSWVSRNTELLAQTTWAIYAASILLGVIGFALGFWISGLVGLEGKMRRTIALETGIQNTPLTFAIILLTFPEPMSTKVLHLPVFYALFVVISSTILTLGFRKILARQGSAGALASGASAS